MSERKYIGGVRQVSDLEDGESAYPEDGMEYECRRKTSVGPEMCWGTVETLQRDDDRLFAQVVNGSRYCVAGDGADCEVVPFQMHKT